MPDDPMRDPHHEIDSLSNKPTANRARRYKRFIAAVLVFEQAKAIAALAGALSILSWTTPHVVGYLARPALGADDLPEIGPCDVALYEMEAVLVARVDGVTWEEYANSHSSEMMEAAAAIYRSKDPAAEIERRYEDCLREQQQ